MNRALAIVVLLFAGLCGSRAIAQECASTATARSSVRVEYDSRASLPGRASALRFETTDDGELAAIEEDSGRVLWRFNAPELAAARAFTGLITRPAVLRFDANGDGVIDAAGGDRVWLYFGLKRAGPYYYALDVTTRVPRVLWRAEAGVLEGLGDAWSTPTVARVRIGGATQNGEHFVVIVGGGFVSGAPASGNRIFMLDAASGRVLWSAGGDAGDRLLVHMTHGIAARVAAIDIDGDGFADRLYTADVGGRVWRFDIWNGRARDGLVTGGMIASLGAAEPAPARVSAADARRFFNAPDVALIQPRGGDAWYNLAIGSGDGDDVRSTSVQNRFYSIRDREPFTGRSQADYDSATAVFDADFTDITTSPQETRVPDDSPGWKLDLALKGAVLAEALTANGVVLFTTFEPDAIVDGSACEPSGTNRVYAVRADSGAAALDLNDDAQVTPTDRYTVLEQKGIAVEPRIELDMPMPPRMGTPQGPGEPPEGAAPSTPRCLVGAELMSRCVPMDTVIRTFWKRTTVN